MHGCTQAQECYSWSPKQQDFRAVKVEVGVSVACPIEDGRGNKTQRFLLKLVEAVAAIHVCPPFARWMTLHWEEALYTPDNSTA